MAERFHLRADVKNENGKTVLVVRKYDYYHKFITHVRNEAKSKGFIKGKMTVTAKEWKDGYKHDFGI